MKQLVDADRRRREGEMATVLAQPHRRGNRSQLAESALGRFVETHNLRRELFDAALKWSESRAKWIGAAGAPRLKVAERTHGTGADVDMKVLRAWRERDMEGRDAMRRAGGEDGLRGVVRLAADGFDLAPHTPAQPVIDALLGLAVHLGLLPPAALPNLRPQSKPRAPLRAATPEPEVADAKPWRPKVIAPATPAAPRERKPVDQAARLLKLKATVAARRERRAADARAAMAVAAE